MFDEVLLDSSSRRSGGLKGRAWVIVGLAGVIAFCLAFFGLPLISPAPEIKVLIERCAVLGIAFGLSALMACYVHEDARQLRLRASIWAGIALLLNVAGFIIYLTYSAAKAGNWKRATLPLAYVFESILLGTLVLIPLIYTEALPRTILTGTILAPPPPALSRAAPPVKARQPATRPNILATPPVLIPKTVVERDEPEAGPQAAPELLPMGVPGGLNRGTRNGVIDSILYRVAGIAPPPPTKATNPTRIRVGGQVEAAKLIFQPRPEYPPLAKVARIQGSVRLEAVISRDGTMQNLKLLSGHAWLAKAAMEAVERWRYQPTLLNGEPVEVVTEIDVNFTLSE